jgi:hypothetical protein
VHGVNDSRSNRVPDLGGGAPEGSDTEFLSRRRSRSRGAAASTAAASPSPSIASSAQHRRLFTSLHGAATTQDTEEVVVLNELLALRMAYANMCGLVFLAALGCLLYVQGMLVARYLRSLLLAIFASQVRELASRALWGEPQRERGRGAGRQGGREAAGWVRRCSLGMQPYHRHRSRAQGASASKDITAVMPPGYIIDRVAAVLVR